MGGEVGRRSFWSYSDTVSYHGEPRLWIVLSSRGWWSLCPATGAVLCHLRPVEQRLGLPGWSRGRSLPESVCRGATPGSACPHQVSVLRGGRGPTDVSV